MYGFVVFFFTSLFYVCIYVAPWSCEAQCDNKAQLDLTWLISRVPQKKYILINKCLIRIKNVHTGIPADPGSPVTPFSPLLPASPGWPKMKTSRVMHNLRKRTNIPKQSLALCFSPCWPFGPRGPGKPGGPETGHSVHVSPWSPERKRADKTQVLTNQNYSEQMDDWITSSPFCPISPSNPGGPGGPLAPFSILQSSSKIEITMPVTLWNGQSKEPHNNLYTFCLLTTSLSLNGLSEYVYLLSLFTLTWSLHSFHEFAELYYSMTKKRVVFV